MRMSSCIIDSIYIRAPCPLLGRGVRVSNPNESPSNPNESPSNPNKSALPAQRRIRDILGMSAKYLLNYYDYSIEILHGGRPNIPLY